MNFLAKVSPTVFFYVNFLYIIAKAYLKLITGKYNWDTYVSYSGKIVEIVKKCGAKVIIEGLEELEKVKPPVVIISNHMSALETLIFGYILGQKLKISFVVKDTLLKYPMFGQLVKFLHPVAIKRKKPKDDFKKIVTSLKKMFKEKVSIVVFPQGTRSISIDEKKFNSIGIKLAKIFNVGVLPVFVKTDFLSTGKLLRDFGKVYPEKDVYVKIFPLIKQVDKSKHLYIIELFKSTFNKLLKQSNA